ncbi:TPA: hypothetical protein ACIVS4_004769, partial [Salmonella enterica subsp. enterica serovar Typhimurium]
LHSLTQFQQANPLLFVGKGINEHSLTQLFSTIFHLNNLPESPLSAPQVIRPRGSLSVIGFSGE